MASTKPPLARGTIRLYKICILLAVGISIWGYSIGILSSILVSQGWREAMNIEDGIGRRAMAPVIAVYYVGTLLSYLLFSHPLADWFGRRNAALAGTAALTAGAVIMGASSSIGVMILGRLVSGLGVGVVSTTVPLYQSEVAPARERGMFVTLNHGGLIVGMAIGLWAGFGFRFWNSDAGITWGWRLSILIELIPIAIFAIGLIFVPETPRWLVEHGDTDKASKVLHWLREDAYTSEAVTHEIHAIQHDVESRASLVTSIFDSDSKVPKKFQSFIALTLSLFTQRPLRARLWRAFLLQFLAQMCGAAAMKYYLPIFLDNLGLEYQWALLAGAVEMTLKIGMTFVEMWAIDRFGRKACLIAGSLIMSLALFVNAILPLTHPDNANKAADVACIVFIFVYALGYSLGFGPAAWVYSSEIFPTTVRARGVSFAAIGGSVGSIIASHTWPIGLITIGSNIYFIFAAINLLSVPIVAYLYPETAGRELEDMDVLFGDAKTSVVDLSYEDGGHEDEGIVLIDEEDDDDASSEQARLLR